METAYCTAAESQVHLAAKADWIALDNATQDIHLQWGRVWLDENYSCLDSDSVAYDETNAPESLKHANSLAGYMDFSEALYNDNPTLESKASAAGSVSTSKTYSGGYKEKDPAFKKIQGLLVSDCTKIKTNAVDLTRV